MSTLRPGRRSGGVSLVTTGSWQLPGSCTEQVRHLGFLDLHHPWLATAGAAGHDGARRGVPAGSVSCVDARGLEPPTPTVSRWCANHLRYASVGAAVGLLLEVETGFEPVYAALQAAASPLGHSTTGGGYTLRADDRVRTGDLNLGKVALYQLSYIRARRTAPGNRARRARRHYPMVAANSKPATAPRPPPGGRAPHRSASTRSGAWRPLSGMGVIGARAASRRPARPRSSRSAGVP